MTKIDSKKFVSKLSKYLRSPDFETTKTILKEIISVSEVFPENIISRAHEINRLLSSSNPLHLSPDVYRTLFLDFCLQVAAALPVETPSPSSSSWQKTSPDDFDYLDITTKFNLLANCLLSIETVPSDGVDIYIDNSGPFFSPVKDHELICGKAKVKAVAAGYDDYEEELILAADAYSKEIVLMETPFKVNETKVLKGIDFEFVYVEPGEFYMDSNDLGYFKVKISRGFWMSKYPVTQAQWMAVMGSKNNPCYFKGNKNYPVENVSWNDAQEFIKKLNTATFGKELDSETVWHNNEACYRLPTDAEWEYACRAGTETIFFWGNSEAQAPSYCWYNDNSGNEIHEVGKKSPNPWGLYDMQGNVSEWVLDWYDENYYDKVGELRTDPANLTAAADRVERSGNWNTDKENLRSADRENIPPHFKDGNLGFRIVLPAKHWPPDCEA
jgi:formylglycine-generating enzyme required for sulfatase activity